MHRLVCRNSRTYLFVSLLLPVGLACGTPESSAETQDSSVATEDGGPAVVPTDGGSTTTPTDGGSTTTPTDGGSTTAPTDGGSTTGDGGSTTVPAGPFTNIVATLITERGSSRMECWTANDGYRGSTMLWDDPDRPFGACDPSGVPSCNLGRLLPTASSLVGGVVQTHWACLLERRATSTNVVATMYREIHGDTVMGIVVDDPDPDRAASAERAGYWDSDSYTALDGSGVGRCARGALEVVTAATDLASGGVKQHVACMLEGRDRATNVVATIYSEVRPPTPAEPDGSSLCLTAENDDAEAAGYWDAEDRPYGRCADDIPSCDGGSFKVTVGMARLPDGRTKYHSACVLPDQLNPTNTVASMRSETLPVTGATCGESTLGAWDRRSPGYFGYCDGDRPRCQNDAERVTAAMSRQPDGSVAYFSSCVLENDTGR